MTYTEIIRRLLGLACLAAPALNVVTTLLYLAGNLALEAVVGLYAMTLFLPMYQGVALTIGQRRPIYGAIVAVLGVFHAVGVGAYTTRAIGQMLVLAGLLQTQEQVWELPSSMPVFLAYGVLGLLGPLLPIISAIGLLRAHAAPTWAAAALIAGGICFFVAQVIGLAYSVTYPLYALLFLIGFTPVGVQLLRAAPAAEERVEAVAA